MPVATFGLDSVVHDGLNEVGDGWSYSTAFSRNLGLISREQQDVLRQTRVAIAGLGGVGGIHLVTLARLGIGRFTIADPDAFEVANFNRQQGASLETVGRGKAEVMAEQARAINPEVELTVLPERVTAQNIDRFLDGADVLVDGIDFFAIAARRLAFAEARRRGIWAITAGPIGFSTAWLAFDPRGMTFDRYFDLSDDMPRLEQLVSFLVGLTPKATQLAYRLDLAHRDVDIRSNKGPSVGLACQLAAGVVATEIVKMVLAPGRVRPAPCFAQFDPFVGRLARGCLRGGNRHPWQRFKRKILRHRLERLGLTNATFGPPGLGN